MDLLRRTLRALLSGAALKAQTQLERTWSQLGEPPEPTALDPETPERG